MTLKEQKRDYRQKNREKLKEKRREYYQKNPERIKERQRKYNQKNREKLKEKSIEYYREYRQKNPEKYIEYHLKEYEKCGRFFGFTAGETAYNLCKWSLTIRKKYKCRCQWCGSSSNLKSHHILPKKQFPEETFNPDNGYLLCHSCHVKCHGILRKLYDV